MKVAVIGAGITGLVCAYELSKNNIETEIFEGGSEIGGIAGTVRIKSAEMPLEKYYHHFFKSDIYLVNLIKELGLENDLIYLQSRMGFFADNALYDFGTPVSLLKFKPLNFMDKLKFGIATLEIMLRRDYKGLENITAHEWLTKNAGEYVYNKVWKPLLITKFGERYRDISMAWFWGKIKLRGTSRDNGKEVLGYLDGSFEKLLKTLEEKLRENGVKINLNTRVESIEKDQKFLIKTEEGVREFQKVVCTAPLPQFLKIAREILPSQYIEEKGNISYTATVCMILVLDRPFTNYYWLNIGDEEIPFGGLIEHTNLLSKHMYGDRHILYISNYLYADSRYYTMSDEELLEAYIPYLQKINKNFNKSWVTDYHVSRDTFAQPVIECGYSKIKPVFEAPVPGLYTASMCNIYPEDRGMNYAVRDGIAAAKKLLGTVHE